MHIQVRPATYAEVEPLHNLYRNEANCQIIKDSFLRRGLADPYLIYRHGHVAGYGAVSNHYDKGQLIAFHTLPEVRRHAGSLCAELLKASGATHISAQSNMQLMLLMLFDFTEHIHAENYLFHDAATTQLTSPAQFRVATPNDDVEDEYVLEQEGAVVASGGFLTHYNPPYGDIYMSVIERARNQGFGSYIAQELKRVCYEAGYRPSARCNPDNPASRRALERAGFLPCGRLIVGAVRSDIRTG